MPILLEDLAAETHASNQRAADRLDAEAHDLEKLEPEATLEERRARIVESARQATAYTLSRLPLAEEAWNLALAALRQRPHGEEAERLLRTFLGVFESGQRLVRAPRALWDMAQLAGAAPERLDELEQAETRFQELSNEARGALEHRLHGWRPADPERLARGLQSAREGKTVKADEARNWFGQR